MPEGKGEKYEEVSGEAEREVVFTIHAEREGEGEGCEGRGSLYLADHAQGEEEDEGY